MQFDTTFTSRSFSDAGFGSQDAPETLDTSFNGAEEAAPAYGDYFSTGTDTGCDAQDGSQQPVYSPANTELQAAMVAAQMAQANMGEAFWQSGQAAATVLMAFAQSEWIDASERTSASEVPVSFGPGTDVSGIRAAAPATCTPATHPATAEYPAPDLPPAPPAPSSVAVFGGSPGGQDNNLPLQLANQSPLTAPRERSAQQWSDIQAVWDDRQDQPYRLMQTMVEFGFDVADIAFATRQTEQSVGDYLTLHGAPDGFAGPATLGRDRVEQAYLKAMDAVLAKPGESARYPQSSNFDVREFNHWYASQDTAEARAFARIHGENFGLDRETVTPGGWIIHSGADNDTLVWQDSCIQRAETGGTISAYQGYRRASAQDLRMVDLILNSEENQALLNRYRGDDGVRGITTDTLPQNEQTERLRALYGSERTVLMLQIMRATEAMHDEFVKSAEQSGAHPPDIPAPQREPSAAHDRWALPPGQYSLEEARAIKLPPGGWCWKDVVTNIGGNDSVIGTVTGYQLGFDWGNYAKWYAAQDTEASQLFAQRYGNNPQITTRTDSWGGGEGTDPTTSTGSFINGDLQFLRDGQINFALDASSGLIAIDVNNPRADLIDPSQVFYDPLHGLVTSVDNVKNDDTSFDKFMMTAIPMVIVGVASWGVGTAAAGAAGGGTLGAVAGGAAGAATGAALMGFITTGRIDLGEVLKSALIGMATAGFAELSGLNEAGLLHDDLTLDVVRINGSTVVTNWATRIGTIGANAAFSGLMSELAGGDFTQGAGRFLLGRLGNSVTEQINLQMDRDSTLTGMERAMGRSMATAVGTAIRYMGNPNGSGYGLAAEFLTSLGIDVLSKQPQVNSGAGNANTATHDGERPAQPNSTAEPGPINGLTLDDGYTLGGSASLVVGESSPTSDEGELGEGTWYSDIDGTNNRIEFGDASPAFVVPENTQLKGGRFVPNADHDVALTSLNEDLGLDPDAVDLYDQMPGNEDDGFQPVGWRDAANRLKLTAAEYAQQVAQKVGGELGHLVQRGLNTVVEAIKLGDIAALKDLKSDIQGYLDARGTSGGLSEAEIMALGVLYAAVEVAFPENVLDFAGAGKAVKSAAALIRIGKNADELAAAVRLESRAVAAEKHIADVEAAAQRSNLTVVKEAQGAKGAWNDALNGKLQSNSVYILDNGHAYATDALGRVSKAEGVLDIHKVDRNTYQQIVAGKLGGEGYDGGHLIATLFGGAGEKVNLIPQLSNVNRGEFRVLEKQWAQDILDGKIVKVEVSPIYAGVGQVPDKVVVRTWTDGVVQVRDFPNKIGG